MTQTSETATESGPSVLRDLPFRLADILSDPVQRIFAVVDGAWFEDVTSLLRPRGLVHRPLYRQAGGDPAIVRGGPWLVDINCREIRSPVAEDDIAFSYQDTEAPSDAALEAHAAELSARMLKSLQEGDMTGGGMLPGEPMLDLAGREGRLEALLEMVGDSPAAVFWIGDAALTLDLIHRHLRSISQVISPLPIETKPLERIDGLELAAAGGDDETTVLEFLSKDNSQRFILRHADPNVMLQVVPKLTPAQLARLMGPAEQLYFVPDTDWGGGTRQVARPRDMRPHPGPLRFTREQVTAIEEMQLKRSRFETMLYLREHAQEETAGMSDEALHRHVYTLEQRGFDLGLSSLTAHLMFAFMCTVGMGDVVDSEEFRQAAQDGRLHPDDALAVMFDEAIRSAEEDEQEEV
ncbi:hypothetical protein E2F50_17440 [Rhizobium deserti]|uniref:DUF4123 domain-containing protein n=1 Tax=Rhizobium deserti TaxID=2547961 RepID=A0A4R5UAR7_9HYPH|nr:hypothetical protein [Rhizobium deserti]TDK32127.1 hypothetical protein E2F50_17440 [Rhizobium deserti]